MKREKGTPVWVKESDYFNATKAVEDQKISTFSRVNVRGYIDVPTFVGTAVVCFVICILIAILHG